MAAVFTRFHTYHYLHSQLSSICHRDTWQTLCKPFCVSTFKGTEKVNDLQYPLTQAEAISYVEKVLEIPNPLQKMLTNPLQLLGEIQKQTKVMIPFTNVVYTKHKIRTLTLEDNIRFMKQKEGGTCFTINTFTRAILQHLGYETYLISGSLPKSRTSFFDAHTGNIVQNVTFKGSLHLVETGTVHPILEPILLDFTRVSPVYQLISYPLRFFTDGPGIIKMCMPDPKQTDPKITDDTFMEDGMKWKCLITYRTLQPITLSHSFHAHNKLAADRSLLPDVHKEPIIFGFSGGKLTSIKGQQFIQYSHDGSPVVKELDSDRVVDTAHEHFPQYPHKYLKQVYQQFAENAANHA